MYKLHNNAQTFTLCHVYNEVSMAILIFLYNLGTYNLTKEKCATTI